MKESVRCHVLRDFLVCSRDVQNLPPQILLETSPTKTLSYSIPVPRFSASRFSKLRHLVKVAGLPWKSGKTGLNTAGPWLSGTKA